MKKGLFRNLFYSGFAAFTVLIVFTVFTQNESELNLDQEKFRKKAEQILNQVPGWKLKLVVTKTEEPSRKNFREEMQHPGGIMISAALKDRIFTYGSWFMQTTGTPQRH